MIRLSLSLFVGLILGTGLGLYLGWVQFPVQFVDSSASDLAPRYQDEYTAMIAGGYLVDGDVIGAIERLRLLEVVDVPAHVRDVTLRYITNSRDIEDIRNLVTLAEALGVLSPAMEPYRRVPVTGQQQP